jgi:poly(3-hydroxybutyrate) depolymerase
MAPLLTRALAALGRLVGWPSRQGRFLHGEASSRRGRVALAPFVASRRQYLLYVPRGYTRWRKSPLIVLCHGCQQTPEDFAQGSRIAAFADARRALVLLPRQRANANAWCCWNWFDPATAAGDGEAAIVEAMTQKIASRYSVDARRITAAGMSAGGGLAAILGLRHANVFRAVVAHSGIACGAAGTPLAARRVLAEGPLDDVAAIGRAAPDRGRREPLLVIQGLADGVVAPRNAKALVAQFLARAGIDADDDRLPPAAVDRHVDAPGHAMRVRDWRAGGGLVARLVEIEGLGHAWSGGDATLRFNDADAPDALAIIDDFLAEVAPGRGAIRATMRLWRGEERWRSAA